ncbi:hypothetical protein B9Z55_021425 [Caenorhabditis nigoni]|uniref:Cytochrome P450 n=1 Tax=Caenorhabditis nigoni TaxID=1611254 RepID=A0A2G5TS20_9PELO|nr:hypothetical protein B9Z55_021425 [Caenorhabditis nigoni]
MILLSLFGVFLILWIISKNQKRSKLPPGPTPLPLIGNIHQLIYLIWKLNGIVPTLDFYRKKYGNAYTIWLGPLPTVNITDYEMAHEIFVKNGKKCVDRQVAPIFEHITVHRWFAQNTIWAHCGPYCECEHIAFVMPAIWDRSPGFGDNRNPSSSPLATRQVKEAALTEKPKEKTTIINFPIGCSSAGDKEGERMEFSEPGGKIL